MKRIALFLMVAGMLSMVACKSAPKKEEATEVQPTEQQADTTQASEVETNADTTQHLPE
ncbi:MAG: hypothetical protein AB7S48_07620 [Bacteroidales bacterium]